MKKAILAGLTAVMVSSGALASEVTGYTDATANTPATAADINANFNALITAINDNNTRITALESAIGNGATDGTYTFIELAVELAADSGTGLTQAYSEISTFSSSGTFTLVDDGTFSGTINENRSTLEHATDGDCGVEGCRDTFNPNFGTQASEPLSGTWTEDASTVTLTIGPGDIVVLNKAGPKLLVFSNKDTVTDEGEPIYDFTNIVMLVKQ